MSQPDTSTIARVFHPLEGDYEPVDINRYHTDELIIQSPHGNLQSEYLARLDSMSVQDPDRIAIHDPIISLAEAGKDSSVSTLVAWMKKLHELHGFRSIHIFEPDTVGERAVLAAETTLRAAIPESAVQIHLLEASGVYSENVVASCSDFRFFNPFNRMVREKVSGNPDRLYFPAPEKSVLDPLVHEKIRRIYKEVHILGHTACGGFGGLEAHDNLEPMEALAHMREGRRAKAEIVDKDPHLEVNLHLRGVNAPIEVIE